MFPLEAACGGGIFQGSALIYDSKTFLQEFKETMKN
jgi:hypothetical protein